MPWQLACCSADTGDQQASDGSVDNEARSRISLILVLGDYDAPPAGTPLLAFLGSALVAQVAGTAPIDVNGFPMLPYSAPLHDDSDGIVSHWWHACWSPRSHALLSLSLPASLTATPTPPATPVQLVYPESAPHYATIKQLFHTHCAGRLDCLAVLAVTSLNDPLLSSLELVASTQLGLGKFGSLLPSQTIAQTAPSSSELHLRALGPRSCNLCSASDLGVAIDCAFTAHAGIEGFYPVLQACQHVAVERVTKKAPPLIMLPSDTSLLSVSPGWLSAVAALQCELAMFRALASSDAKPPLALLPVVVTVGAKAMGKSTLNRMLVNSLLAPSAASAFAINRVAFMDLDPGQTELTEPGVVSLTVLDRPLLGPPYTHMNPYPAQSEGDVQSLAQFRCLRVFVGSTSPSQQPQCYTAAVSRLMAKYTALAHHLWTGKGQVLPLVVNTMGWTKGMGLDLLGSILEITQPAYILHLGQSPIVGQQDLAAATLDTVIATSTSKLAQTPKYLRLEPGVLPPNSSDVYGGVRRADLAAPQQQQLRAPLVPSDVRNMALLAAFAQSSPAAPGALSGLHTTVARHLNDPLMPTYRIALTSSIAVCVLHHEIDYADALRALNGTLVALARIPLSSSAAPAPGLPYPLWLPAAQWSNCLTRHEYLGIGLVRSIQVLSPLSTPAEEETEQVFPPVAYISTAIPPATLSRVNCLIRGDLELPSWMFLSTANIMTMTTLAPYTTAEFTEGVGAEAIKLRTGIARKAQYPGRGGK
ncbi:Polynucleotide 5'-hydroxyl-kinase grc3 [Sorochytrium milnesiophthora]